MAKILVIDDDPIVGELFKKMLAKSGHEIVYESDGESGLEAARKSSFDTIIVDLKMPGIGGIEVLEQIKQFDPDSAVIIFTGNSSFETAQEGMRLGALDYLTKPFNLNDVTKAIDKAITVRGRAIISKNLLSYLESRNIELEEVVEDRTKEVIILSKIAQEISSHLELTDILKDIVDKVVNALDIEMCSLLMLDSDKQHLEIKYSCGLDKEIIKNAKVSLVGSISGWVIKNSQAILVKDIETDERFHKQNDNKYYNKSFISAPLIVNHEAIGVINISNKKNKQVFTDQDLIFSRALANEASIAIENAKLYASLEDTSLSAIIALVAAINAKDHYTKDHSDHVTRYGIAIAKELEMSEKEIIDIERACVLHDIGKIGIRDEVLLKPGKLTDEEWEEIKSHPSKGAVILRPLTFLGDVVKIVEQHHERFDGRGYPNNLKGTDIMIGARILAVVDSFDAMTTDRPYRKALSMYDAIDELTKNKGTQFDPLVVDAFIRVLNKELTVS